MKKFFLPFIFIIPSLLLAQTHVIVKGKVTDISHKPIPYATIQNTQTEEGNNTDASGNYSFKTVLPATLKVSFIGYKTLLKKVFPINGKDTIWIDFVLKFDSTQLKQVEVSTGTYKPELLKESGSFKDFEINQNKIWLLYNYRKGDHIEVYDTGMHYLTRTILKHRSDNISKTRFNYLYTENSDSVNLIDYDVPNNFIDMGSVGSNEFHQFIKGTYAYNAPYYYYLFRNSDFSAMKYEYSNRQGNNHGMLYFYKNNVMSRQNDDLMDEMYDLGQELYDDQGAPIEMGEQLDYKVHSPDGESGETGRNIEKKLMGLRLLVAKPFCPLRVVRDSIYIFNFNSDSIYVYNSNNKRIRQIPLAFRMQGLKYSNEDMIVDEKGDECYYKFVVNGAVYLQKIDLNTGKRMNTRNLDFPLPEKIRILSGIAYYTYSDYSDNQMFIRHLYKQKLN